ncbi:phosphate propanoyltransferase [Brevibacillus sp. SYSU BS000544]|uniref:phosphate propanoyltransferase n=1 Tax=Brevibacillus sp. SYSU BS000544 TaxID=3416443 RepID=UPI003CE55053
MAVITETMLRAMLRKGIPNPFPIQTGDRLTPAAIDFLKGRGIRTELIIPSGNKPSQAGEDEPASGGEKNASVAFQQGHLIPVGVSNRHVHLTADHIEQLFGKSYSLTIQKELSQTGTFAAKEQVTLVGPTGMIEDVRVLGPTRGASQVEISRADGFTLGIHPPVRQSGNLDGTPGITLIGTKGVVTLEKGLILAKRHVHMPPQDAQQLGVTQGDSLILQTTGERAITFEDVTVRVGLKYVLDFHIDLDEANAASLKQGDQVKVIGKNGQLFSCR